MFALSEQDNFTVKTVFRSLIICKYYFHDTSSIVKKIIKNIIWNAIQILTKKKKHNSTQILYEKNKKDTLLE